MIPSPDHPPSAGQFGLNAGDPAISPTSEGGGPWWRPVPAARPAGSSAPATTAPTDRIAFNALLVFTALVLLAPQSLFPVLQPLRLPFLAASFAIGSYILHHFLHGGPLTIRVRELTILAALLAWAVLTLPWSLWPGGSVDTILGSYSKSLVIFFLIVNLVVTPTRLRRMAWLLTLLSIPVAATALANFHAGVYMQGSNVRIAGYQAAITENPNDLALLLNVTLPLSGGLLPGERRHVARALIVLTMLCDIAAIIVTLSRAGFVVLLVTTALFLWKSARRRGASLAALIAVAALACVPFLPGGYLQRLGTSINIEADTTGSAGARWQLAQAAAAYLVQHPLVGTGIGAGILGLNEQSSVRWVQVHNTYLEYALELGLPGLILFLFLLGSALNGTRLAERRLRAAKAPRALLSLHDGVQLSLVAFAVGALFSPGAYGWVTHYTLGMAVASRIACTRLYDSATARRNHGRMQ